MLSLVTACMNRESHLRQTLPHWLTLSGIDEVVVVDWSTQQDISDLLDLDPRVRVVRAEGEARWVLAYAYNLGVFHARGDVVLKCDADCLPEAPVTSMAPAPGRFFAGHWRSGREKSKPSVNGQCLFTRGQWEQVNGYSEILRRYGHDDTDFYARLGGAGHVRAEIVPDLLAFVDHSDGERIAHQPPLAGSRAEQLLHQAPGFHENINIIIASMLPWGRWFERARFEVTREAGRHCTVRRDTSREIPITPALAQFAYSQTLRAYITKICGFPAQRLANQPDETCLAELERYIARQSVKRPAA